MGKDEEKDAGRVRDVTHLNVEMIRGGKESEAERENDIDGLRNEGEGSDGCTDESRPARIDSLRRLRGVP